MRELSLKDLQLKVYDTGYTDAYTGSPYRETFTDIMHTCEMEEYYDRGWTDGRLDREPQEKQ